MTAPHARRGFLRRLATLPLIGGSVALIGKPTAAAVPPSPGMMATYLAWLHYEGRALGAALGTQGLIPHVNPSADFHNFADMTATAGGAFARAPVVLAAAGCPLTSPEAEEMWGPMFKSTYTGALAPASKRRLLDEYETWLACELNRVGRELRPAPRLLGDERDVDPSRGRPRDGRVQLAAGGAVMNAAGVTMADLSPIESAGLEMRAVGLVLSKLGETPGSIDSEIACWLGGLLLHAVKQLNAAHGRLVTIAEGGRP